eukprot:Sspe_Gene.43728::Locus_21355_Transcript_1_1_Confidence_1.000_Length_1992::g.43728::m.43728
MASPPDYMAFSNASFGAADEEMLRGMTLEEKQQLLENLRKQCTALQEELMKEGGKLEEEDGGWQPLCMGDMGDEESTHIHDIHTSEHRAIIEPEQEKQQESGPESSKDKRGLVIIMVGLPGRGKTYIARRLCRWLNWKGTQCRIFNVGKYRREVTRRAQQQHSDYFDHENAEAAAEREHLAALASEDLMLYLRENPGSVAIFDATNSTIERREKLVKCFGEVVPEERVLFLESVCTDEEVIQNNIIRAKMGNEDYKGKDLDYVLKDFKERIKQYEKVYQPLNEERDKTRSWVQLRNTLNSHGGGHITINRVTGYLPTRLLFFLFNLRTVASTVYLARAANSSLQDDLGERGWQYAAALRRFFNHHSHRQEKMQVWTSPSPRSVLTARWFTEDNHFIVKQYASLREIDLGECHGRTKEEVLRECPAAERAKREYNYAWPRGESYQDMNVRLEQVIFDIHQSDTPVLIIADEDVCKGLYAYLAEMLPEYCVYLRIPENSVIEFTYRNHDLSVQVYDLTQQLRDVGPVDPVTKKPRRKGYLTSPPILPPPLPPLHPKLENLHQISKAWKSSMPVQLDDPMRDGELDAASVTSSVSC